MSKNLELKVVKKTYIKGKDACLEESIAKMQNILKVTGFEIELASWLNPVPNVYSLHIKDHSCPALFTNGKGSSQKATLASALGEFFERLETNYFFSDFWLGSLENQQHSWLYYPNEKTFKLADFRNCLNNELWDIYDVNNQLEAESFLSINDDFDAIRCLPMFEECSEKDSGKNLDTATYFPMNLLSNLYASNGLCAGNTEIEAKVQGLSEVFERWVKSKILKENICLPVVPEAIIQKMPKVLEARQKLMAEGIFVSIRDASLGGLYPVMNVTLIDQSTGQCFASFGAHPIFEVALERTLTESLQGKSLDKLDGFQIPVFDEDLVADDENIENHFIDSSGLLHAHFISHQYDYQFSPWDFIGDTAKQWEFLVSKVNNLGGKVFTAVYNHYGIPAARVIVPGFSEIYPMEELSNSNQNQGRKLRNLLVSLESSEKTPEVFLDAYEELEYLAFSDHQNIANLVGLLPDKGSLWQKFKIIDLKLSLTLASKCYDLASDCLQDAIYYVDSQPLIKHYQALEFIVEIKSQDSLDCFPIEEVQTEMFGETLVKEIWDTIEGKTFFWGLKIGHEMFNSSQNHQNLLELYLRTNEVKEKHA